MELPTFVSAFSVGSKISKHTPIFYVPLRFLKSTRWIVELGNERYTCPQLRAKQEIYLFFLTLALVEEIKNSLGI